MAKTAEKTVYISMGTINQNQELYRNCIHALGKTDWQVIFSMGTNTEQFENLPDNNQIYESVDQMTVLSIADAFLTHCGMNSASEGLFFCVPPGAVPPNSGAGAVAKRTEELDAGIRLNSISEENIMKALNSVLSEPNYQENASKISDSFHKCGGAAEVKTFLEGIIAQKR